MFKRKLYAIHIPEQLWMETVFAHIMRNSDFFGRFELHNIDTGFVCSMALGTSTYRNNKRRYDHDIFNLIKSAEEELPRAPLFPIKIA